MPSHPLRPQASLRLLAVFLCRLLATLATARASQLTYLQNGNYVVVNTAYTGSGNVANVGSISLYNGSTNALISTVTGSTAGDQIGSGGIVQMVTGYYYILSPHRSNGAAANAGALTMFDPVNGLNGVISTTNSLVSSSTNDQIGSGGVNYGFNTGYYLVLSPQWSNGPAAQAGAVTSSPTPPASRSPAANAYTRPCSAAPLPPGPKPPPRRPHPA